MTPFVEETAILLAVSLGSGKLVGAVAAIGGSSSAVYATTGGRRRP